MAFSVHGHGIIATHRRNAPGVLVGSFFGVDIKRLVCTLLEILRQFQIPAKLITVPVLCIAYLG